MLDRFTEDNLGILWRVELGGVEPDVLALWAFLATIRNDLASLDHLFRMHYTSALQPISLAE